MVLVLVVGAVLPLNGSAKGVGDEAGARGAGDFERRLGWWFFPARRADMFSCEGWTRVRETLALGEAPLTLLRFLFLLSLSMLRSPLHTPLHLRIVRLDADEGPTRRAVQFTIDQCASQIASSQPQTPTSEQHVCNIETC